MAWNIPGGSSDKDGRNPWQRKRRRRRLDRLPASRCAACSAAAAAASAAGSPSLLVLWLAFNSFVLVTEQQRGVVLRFGQFARICSPARTSSGRGRSSA